MKVPKIFWFALTAIGGVAAAVLVFALPFANPNPKSNPEITLPPGEKTSIARFDTTIREVPGTPRVLTSRLAHNGEPVSASCSACHTTTSPNLNLKSGEALQAFHQGLHFAHGSQSCLNCHNEENYDTLRLANGTAIEYADVMTLCGQCHGPQLRDYQRGLHGGMNGHWDLSRGPRTRNNCIHCHDPHAPAFPIVQPVFPPKDRVTRFEH